METLEDESEKEELVRKMVEVAWRSFECNDNAELYLVSMEQNSS